MCTSWVKEGTSVLNLKPSRDIGARYSAMNGVSKRQTDKLGTERSKALPPERVCRGHLFEQFQIGYEDTVLILSRELGVNL